MNHHQESQQFVNPWEVPSLDEFLFYCCPECDLRTKERDELYNHAVQRHKYAKVLLHVQEMTHVKQEVQFNEPSDTSNMKIEDVEESQLNTEDIIDPLDVNPVEEVQKKISKRLPRLIPLKEMEEPEGQQTNNEEREMKECDSLGDIPLEENEDFPLPSPNLTREEIIQICQQRGCIISAKQRTERLYTKLNSHIKKNHPVRFSILKMENTQLRRLYDGIVKLNEGYHFIERVENRRLTNVLKNTLIRYYFTAHPTCPLKTLKQHLNFVSNSVEIGKDCSSTINVQGKIPIPRISRPCLWKVKTTWDQKISLLQNKPLPGQEVYERSSIDDMTQFDNDMPNGHQEMIVVKQESIDQEKPCEQSYQSLPVLLKGPSIVSNVVNNDVEEDEMDSEDIVDPLDVMPLEEMEDVPLVPPNLPRKELIELYRQKGISINNFSASTEQMRATLNSTLKKRHPVKLHIQQMQLKELQGLYDVLLRLNRGPHIKHIKSLRSGALKLGLPRYYFNSHPSCPLESLKRHLKFMENPTEANLPTDVPEVRENQELSGNISKHLPEDCISILFEKGS